jgi:Holliday junction resolvase
VNTTGIPLSGGGMRSNSKRGISDIIAIINGRAVCIEVKIGNDKQSHVQESFERSVVNAGGVYLIAKDFDSFSRSFKAIL